jgi:hypothetical protein
MKIFKYELITFIDKQTIKMPWQAKILSAKEQDGNLCLWALVDPDIGFEMDYTFHVIGTGNPIDPLISINNLHFIDTVVMSYGLVWHVFREKL